MKLRAGDFLIATIIVLLALGIWIYPHLGEEGTVCRINVDGKLFGEMPLSRDDEMRLPGCIVRVEDGAVFVTDSTCPDKVCERTGKISKSGESIVCVPNRVSVEVSGESETDVIAG